MKKAIFIIPYFGKFNNYFQLFLNSCGENLEYNWLIITDDKTTFKYPQNVKVVYMKFEEIQKMVKDKFAPLNIKLEKIYKLCDYKPLYGYIFENFIKEYKFWGYCDNDIIFGKISNFIKDEDLNNYDKIGILGHFTLIKNNKENNELFKYNNEHIRVLCSEKNFKFDEEFGEDFGCSINNIFEKNNKKIKFLDGIADIYVKSSNFKLTHFNISKNKYEIEKKNNAFFVWEKGNLKRVYKKSGQIEEFLYIHLQKRKMKVLNTNDEIFKIIPNSFENIENTYLKKEYNNIKIKNFNLHYFKIRIKNLKNKIKNKFGE